MSNPYSLHPQPQAQQQQLQQPHSPLPQDPNNPNANANSDPNNNASGAPGAGAGPMGQAMNLASVLHYLQSEWRRWERDRNEWEIERAEMRARIALLEGERRSAENLKVDLTRRCKMLEFALRQERSKTLSTSASSHNLAGGTMASSKLHGLIQEDRHEGGSESPKSTGSHLATDPFSSKYLPNGPSRALQTAPLKSDSNGNGSSTSNGPAVIVNGHLGTTTNANTWGGAAMSKTGTMGTVGSAMGMGMGMGEKSPWKNVLSAPIRDGKSRARSRDYLKQCLQEISYLTSAAALNPLPNKLSFDLTAPRQPEPSTDDQDANHSAAGDDRDNVVVLPVPPRPKKTLPEEPIPAAKKEEEEAGNQAEGGAGAEAGAQHESNEAAKVADAESELGSSVKGQDQKQVLTAIYKPESREAWKEALRSANEKAEQAKSEAKSQIEDGRASISRGSSIADLTEHPISDSLSEAGDKAAQVKSHWKQSRQLKSHLDSVRSIKFGADGETIISGSVDCTVKVWRLDLQNLSSGKSTATGLEIEPQTTFRGHTAAVTSIATSSSGRIFSGSIDSTIRVWRTPPPEHETYSSYDASLGEDTLIGHTDAVWDVALLASPTDQEGYLVSASADGSVKVWDTTKADQESGSKGYPLLLTWTYNGIDGKASDTEEITPISVSAYYPDLQNVLVGYSNGVAKVFSLTTGKEVMTFGEPSSAGLSQVVCHPTLDTVVAGDNEGELHFYDSKTAQLTSTVKAHTDTVNALDMDPNSSSSLISGGDDCSCKVWDLVSRTCTQDWTLHRRKSDQGVLAVQFSDKLPVLASGGADGVIRVYVKAS